MNNKKLKTLLIDLDDTVYNLSELCIFIANNELGTSFCYKDNANWFWNDYPNATQKYFESMLLRKGIFYDGKPIENAVQIINKLYDSNIFENIIFVTTPQFESGSCYTEKFKWCKRYFHWFTDKNIVFTSNKKLLCNDDTIIIDDGTHNLDLIDKGIKICFGREFNKDYEGLRIDNWLDIYDYLIKLIEREGEI